MQAISNLLQQPMFEVKVSKRQVTEQQKFGDFKKYCYERAKAEWNHPKPFNVAWGQKTSHLKKLSDWHFIKSTCDDSERREKFRDIKEQRSDVWSITFWGSLRIRE